MGGYREVVRFLPYFFVPMNRFKLNYKRYIHMYMLIGT